MTPASDKRHVELVIVPSQILRVLLIVIAVLVALSTAGQAPVLALPDFPLRDVTANLFYVDHEQSLPNLYSSLLLLASSLLAGLIAHQHRRGDGAYVRHWTVLSLVLAVMTIDEFASLHESSIEPLRRVLNIEGGPLWFAWVVPGAAAVLIFGIAFLRFMRHLPRPTRRRLWTAGMAYLSGAIGLELIGGWHISIHGDANLPAVAIVTIEETLEMLGIAVLLHALLAYIPGSLPDLAVRLRVSGAN